MLKLKSRFTNILDLGFGFLMEKTAIELIDTVMANGI